jgi:uncharacterized protein (TIGR02145 family)
MKRKILPITLLIIATLAVIIYGCKKDDDSSNQAPTCHITAPSNGQQMEAGQSVTISVDANDSDGSIEEVRFFVDGVGKGTSSSFPYNYTWNTNGESIGTHTLKATAIDNNGDQTSDEISVQLTQGGGGNTPIAEFTVNTTSGNAPLTVNFSDQSINNPTSWQWDFGDGGTSIQQNPNYTYNTEGAYTVSLSVINSYGSDTEEKSDYITVSSGGNTPIAEFTVNTTSGNAPLTVSFTDQSSNNPTSWQWDFGDGGTSTQQNPTHAYNNTGTYTVTLTATNIYGSDIESKSNYIVVSGGSGYGTFTDPRDNQTYNTVIIGEQEWFAQNLNHQINNSWCYDNNSNNCNEYGRLYTWDAANNACPDGWHLPTNDEWKQLEMFLGMSQSEADETGWRGTDEGKRLKSTTGWNSGGNGTNEVGFSALPGGYRTISGSYYGLGNYGYWWSATEYSSSFAWRRSLDYDNDKVYRNISIKEHSFGVRCVRD